MPRPASIFSVIALLLAGTLSCKHPPEAVPEKKMGGVHADVELSEKALSAARVTIGTPSVSPRRTSVTVSGIIDFFPDRVAHVGPNVLGRVREVLVSHGQHVNRGATLLLIDSADIGKARADLIAAQSRMLQTDAELSREKKLFSGGAASERSMLTAETDHKVAESNVHAAQDRLSALGPGVNRGGQSTIPLVSPIDGEVLEVHVHVGQPVSAVETLVTVGEIDKVWLSVDVYERDLAKVHMGDDVRVTSIAYPGRIFEGHVEHIGSMVDKERHAIEAHIVLPNADEALRPGMTVTCRIVGADSTADGGTMITVPRGAVQTIDGQPFVFVEQGPGKFELRAVERGAEFEGDVEILRGVAANEKIATEGTFVLKSEALKAQMGAND